MQTIVYTSVLLVLSGMVMVLADKRVTCFDENADVGGETFPDALKGCMKYAKEHHEAELGTHQCLWGKLGVKADGQMKEKFVKIATEGFKKRMGEVADQCNKSTMTEICQCLDDILSHECNDDDKFITTTVSSA